MLTMKRTLLMTVTLSAVILHAFTTTTQSATPPIGTVTVKMDAIDSTQYEDFDDYIPYRSDQHDLFSWELLKNILQSEDKNVIISPFSVKLVLALLSEAAGNNTQTQKELISTITDIKSTDNLRGYYKKILSSLKKDNPYYTLNLATKLYIDEFIEPQQKYTALLQSHYDTDIKRIRFSDAHVAAEEINDWCKNVTKGQLQQLVNEESIKNKIMVLTNALYFHGLWRRQFNETFEGVFFKTPEEQRKAEYMDQTEYFYHYESKNLNAQILRLPYKGKKFSMFILLPNTKVGLNELIINLENEHLKNMQFMMDSIKVKVTLPKFKFDFNKDLKETLNNLNIKEIFTDTASLPGLARGADVAQQLKVSNIIQKAGIEVNAKGTEAFAATVVEIENKFGGSNVLQEFNVNRPFIFFIEDELTGSIIFAGKVLEPFF